MLSEDQVRDVIGSTAYGSDGQKLGKVGQIYFDNATDQPEWVTINTGLFGTNESFVPLEDATFDGERLTVAYIRDKVKDAPSVGDDGYLSPEEERTLYDYYRRGWEDYLDRTGMTQTTSTTSGTAADYAAPAPVSDGSITRSEEHVDVSTRQQEAGRARLRKWVDTEYVNVTVPVRREMAALETEPAADGSGGELADPEQPAVVLSEERPVVSKVVEPVQQVRIGTETVTEEQTVTTEVSKERVGIETEGVDTDRDNV